MSDFGIPAPLTPPREDARLPASPTAYSYIITDSPIAHSKHQLRKNDNLW